MRLHTTRCPRPGNYVALTAVMAIFLVGVVAFAVDTSWMTLTQSELQNAADSSALAGAWPLMNGCVLYQLANQTQTEKDAIVASYTAQARKKAIEYAWLNSAGGITNLTLKDSDVEFGFTDATGNYIAQPSAPYLKFPNTIKVKIRRDSTSNGALKFFFAPAIGTDSISLTATARATIYAGTLSSFKVGKVNSLMLPATYDYYAWQDFISTGLNPDGTALNDTSGNPVIQVYPSIKDAGNFGLISLNDTHVGASTMESWIDYGMRPADVQTLLDNKLLPVSISSTPAWEWTGETGFKSSNVQDVNGQIGKTYLLPLFRPYDANPATYQPGMGVGSNFNYDIIAFVGIKIMQPQDATRQVYVQPAAYVDPNAVLDNLLPAGSDPTVTTVQTTFSPPKLSN
jgi:Flp pilus assembly protein TadG